LSRVRIDPNSTQKDGRTQNLEIWRQGRNWDQLTRREGRLSLRKRSWTSLRSDFCNRREWFKLMARI